MLILVLLHKIVKLLLCRLPLTIGIISFDFCFKTRRVVRYLMLQAFL